MVSSGFSISWSVVLCGSFVPSCWADLVELQLPPGHVAGEKDSHVPRAEAVWVPCPLWSGWITVASEIDRSWVMSLHWLRVG